MKLEHEYYKEFPRNFGFSLSTRIITFELGRHYVTIYFRKADYKNE